MTFTAKVKHVSLLAFIAALPLLSGCGDSNFHSSVMPVLDTPPPSPPTPPPPPASVAPGTVLEVNDLTKGLCADTDGNSRVVDTVTVRDCNGPHEFEVSGLIIQEDAFDVEFPGRIDLRSQAQLGCEDLFEQYTGRGYFDSNLDLDTITPSANTWATGDRTVICLVVGIDGAMLTEPAVGN